MIDVTDAWGVTDGFEATDGTWQPTDPETRRALHRAFGADAFGPGPSGEGDADEREPAAPPATWFVSEGDAARLWNPADLELEDGTILSGVHSLPMDLPIGYHWLHPLDGWPSVRMIVAPRRCPDPGGRRWGWATQLYALRSSRSWGIGDLGDLMELARWTSQLGGRAILLNPMHAPPPDQIAAPSPYFASSRLMANPLMLAVDDIDGSAELHDDLTMARNAGRALNAVRTIDRELVWAAKEPALRALFALHESKPRLRDAFDSWTARQTIPVVRWATFCAISADHGRPWSRWPEELRDPYGSAVAEYATAHGGEVRFYAWLQWQLDRQRAGAAARGVDLVGDLAVGFEPDGFDAWLWQDVLALGTRVGAPPDTFNSAGQDWGLPPFIPWKLHETRFQPFIDTIRANLTHVGGVRIDHVMGLFRLFCIPPGVEARNGAYVRYPSSELLDLLCLEATRAGAFVVGEDLGTVEGDVRYELASRGILGCKVLWFEETAPKRWNRNAVASTTTHDLPTVPGVWTGTDVANRRMLGPVDEGADPWFRSRIVAVAPGAESVRDAVTGVYEALAQSPCELMLTSMEDALGVNEAPNMPGTIDEWPNWRIALPTPLESIITDQNVIALAQRIDELRRMPVAATSQVDTVDGSGDPAITAAETEPG